jgi:hypothetical protein
MKFFAAVVGLAMATQATANGFFVGLGFGAPCAPVPVVYSVPVQTVQTVQVVQQPVQVVQQPVQVVQQPVVVSAPVVYTPVVAPVYYAPAPVYCAPAPVCGWGPFVSFGHYSAHGYRSHHYHGFRRR